MVNHRAQRLQNGLIPGAAANVAFQRVEQFLVAGLGVFIEQRLGAHQHAWGAKATLNAAVVDKGGLQFLTQAV